MKEFFTGTHARRNMILGTFLPAFVFLGLILLALVFPEPMLSFWAWLLALMVMKPMWFFGAGFALILTGWVFVLMFRCPSCKGLLIFDCDFFGLPKPVCSKCGHRHDPVLGKAIWRE